MNFDAVNAQLKKLNTECSIKDAHSLIVLLMKSLGIDECKPEELLIHPSIQREISRFVKAPGFRNQAAAYVLPHNSSLPLDLKLYWLHKTTKANLSWVIAITPNYEDNPENNPNANIGIDFALNEECDRIFIILSKNLKIRVLELHESLSHTQREILENWVVFSQKLDQESETYKDQLQKHLWKSFDFEPTNRKFYQELVTQFDLLVGHLNPEISEEEAKMFAVRFIGRTLFLWFLSKKKFINPDNKYFEVVGLSDQTKYYRDKLEPLFFEVLNTEVKKRTYDDKVTPFLNGGLFEPIETDFYKDRKLTFPDGFFTQFFNMLNHYNFTVDEGTSEYEHVAVDPEMLGRVFENLLASINEETGKQARKAKGAFYTPREIVDYMCQQSLMEYLKTKLPDTKNRNRRIKELVTMSEPEFREQDHNKRRDWKKDLGQDDVIKALDEIRVLDPAVGSGAFPMGMLTLLVKVYSRVDTTREKNLSKLKWKILSQSLYGVDIDQMAIQISRLRAWLSMLVDMESLKKAEPLPNLDFKFVCANTLIPLDDGPNSLFDADVDLKKKLIGLRDQYYRATRKTEKNKIRSEYLQNLETGNLLASEREKQLKDYNPFNPLNSSSFYDPSLMHGVEIFDVVIGNPPYISAWKMTEQNPKLREKIKKALQDYKFLTGHWDLYIAFVARGHHVLKNYGVLSYIVPNPILQEKYATGVRKFLLEEMLLHSILEFNDVNVFEGVARRTTVLLALNKKEKSDYEIKILGNNEYGDTKINNNVSMAAWLNNPNHAFLIHGNPDIDKLLSKIEKKTHRIGNFFYVNYGVQPVSKRKGVFKKKDIVGTIKKGNAKEFYEGKDVKKWSLKYRGLWLDYKENELYGPRSPKLFQQDKIVVRDISDKNHSLAATLDKTNRYTDNTNTLLVPYKSIEGTKLRFNFPGYQIIDSDLDLRYVLAMLLSSLEHFYFNNRYAAKSLQGSSSHTYPSSVRGLVIKNLNPNKQKPFIDIVDRILTLKEKNADTNELEKQIDELVMGLYELTGEEKQIIRNS